MKLSQQQIKEIYQSIENYIKCTPLITNDYINEEWGLQLYLKCENLQHIGAFKARGAYRALQSLTEEQRQKGVATHSSGNHAQALAKAAKTFGISAWIVMPENSPATKVRGVRENGGEVFFCPSTFNDREKKLNEVVSQTGATFVPPFDHPLVIEGQSTCAYEIVQQMDGKLDAIFVPVGGGGLAAGTCLAVNALQPQVQVFGAEPKNMDDAYRALQSGKPEVNAPDSTTIADGLRTNVGQLPLEVMKEHLSDLFLVDESEIITAMKMVWERFKIIIEPSCAVPVAALLKNKKMFQGKTVVVIVTGGNVDLEKVPFLTQS